MKTVFDKKFFSFILVLCSIMQMSFAQTGHLKFMGIPIDGTVSTFQQKLEAKGMTYDALTSKQLEAGIRVMNGVFAGYKSDIVLYYTPKTQKMYKVMVVMESTNEETINSRIDEIADLLLNKYEDCFYRLDSIDGQLYLYPKRYSTDKEFVWTRCYGTIKLFKTNDDNPYDKTYYLLLSYTDQINDDKNDEAKLSDM